MFLDYFFFKCKNNSILLWLFKYFLPEKCLPFYIQVEMLPALFVKSTVSWGLICVLKNTQLNVVYGSSVKNECSKKTACNCVLAFKINQRILQQHSPIQRCESSTDFYSCFLLHCFYISFLQKLSWPDQDSRM